MVKNSQKPELLLPAGSPEKLRVAFAFGADAVYAGIPTYSMRERINKFDLESLREGIEYAHGLSKKVYVTINTFPHEPEFAKLPEVLQKLAKLNPDVIIVVDPGVLELVKKEAPEVDIHLSTQMNTVNSGAAKFWYEAGVKRIILARELSLTEIKAIKKAVPEIELEIFVHGDMCMAYSGRCLISNYLVSRDANQGKCAQSCRWKYHLVEEERPGEYLPVEEDKHGTYIFNSRTLCLVEHLSKLCEAGIASFKIEGRSKSQYYAAVVAKEYCQAIDLIDEGKLSKGALELKLKEAKGELLKTANRGFTTGFMFCKPDSEAQRYDTAAPDKSYLFCGIVKGEEDGFVVIEPHNHIRKGEEVEFVTPTETFKIKLDKLLNKNKKEVDSIHGGCEDTLYLKTDKEPPEFTVLRKVL